MNHSSRMQVFKWITGSWGAMRWVLLMCKERLRVTLTRSRKQGRGNTLQCYSHFMDYIGYTMSLLSTSSVDSWQVRLHDRVDGLCHNVSSSPCRLYHNICLYVSERLIYRLQRCDITGCLLNGMHLLSFVTFISGTLIIVGSLIGPAGKQLEHRWLIVSITPPHCCWSFTCTVLKEYSLMNMLTGLYQRHK